MLARNVRRISNNRIGKFPLLTMGRMGMYESAIERDFLYFADIHSEIVSICEQPLKIEYVYQDKKRHYYPDFKLDFGDRPTIIVECKPHELLEDEANQRKFAVGRDYCTKEGWQFLVVTDRDIRTWPAFANIKTLTKYARHKFDVHTKAPIVNLLMSKGGSLSIEQIRTNLCADNPARMWAVLLHMVYHHELHLDIQSAPITNQSIIHLQEVQNGTNSFFDRR